MSPFAAFSAENRIAAKMKTLDISASFLASLSGVSNTKISHALQGIRQLLNHEAAKVLDALGELEKLSAACRPIPVAYKNANVIRELLAAWRDKKFFVAVGSTEETATDAIQVE